jgi:hypothetical protein
MKVDRAAYLREYHKQWRARMSSEQRRKRLESAARYRAAYPDRVKESQFKHLVKQITSSEPTTDR